MSRQYCICLVILSYIKYLDAALQPPMSPTSTYKPSSLLLPPGFESQKAPLQPMMYPYAVSSTTNAMRLRLSTAFSTTPGWVPVAAKVAQHSYTTIPTLSSRAVSTFEERIATDESKYSSASYKEGPVFESIIYGTWKPAPPLPRLKVLNGTKKQQHSSGDASETSEGLLLDGSAYSRTIHRQHGGFIGHIQQKPTQADRSFFSATTPSSSAYKPKSATEFSAEQKMWGKLKKQGRRKIRPMSTSTEQSLIERNSISEEARTTKENVIKVDSLDAKSMEVAKQMNDSTEIKYNHEQASTHSIDVMTTADVKTEHDYADRFAISSTQWATKSSQALSTEAETNADANTFKMYKNPNAAHRSWPADFMEGQLLTTLNPNHQLMPNNEDTDPSEIPLALSALNIPPSLWPKLPGNITKMGKPYEAENSAEEPALCVPITVREQNIMNTKELIYIERIFCFPMPQQSTSYEHSLTTAESGSTLKSVATPKIQNLQDFIDSKSQVFNASGNPRAHFNLVTSILVIYFTSIA